MEGIKNWAFSICTAAVCGAVLNMILPEGGVQKTYKAVFCVFFLLVLIAPISDIELPDFSEIDKNIGIESSEITENEFSQSSAYIIEQKIIDDTASLLEEKGITPKDISVKVNISENQSIDISKFVLILEENPTELSSEIAQKIGVSPEIIISGDLNNGNS